MTDPKSWLNSDDIREAARRRLPKGLFDFIDRGAEDEFALRNNRSALQDIKLRSRVLRDVSRRSTDCTLMDSIRRCPSSLRRPDPRARSGIEAKSRWRAPP